MDFKLFLLTVTDKKKPIAVKEPKLQPITVQATTPLRPWGKTYIQEYVA